MFTKKLLELKYLLIVFHGLLHLHISYMVSSNALGIACAFWSMMKSIQNCFQDCHQVQYNVVYIVAKNINFKANMSIQE